MMPHPNDCPCIKCEGLRLYPEPSLCDWCGEVHPGNSANCYDPEAEEQAKIFSGDTAENEQLCWEVFRRLREVTNYVKEQYNMIPDPQVPEQQQQQTRGRGAGSARTGYPYLNQANQSEHLDTESKVKVKILDCRVNPKPVGNQSPIELKLAIRGRTILWGIRTTNKMLPVLIKLFGKDENDWVDKEIMMSLQMDEFSGKIWPHVDPAEPKETKPRKKGE